MARLGYASEAIFDRTVSARQFAHWEAWATVRIDAKQRLEPGEILLDPW